MDHLDLTSHSVKKADSNGWYGAYTKSAYDSVMEDNVAYRVASTYYNHKTFQILAPYPDEDDACFLFKMMDSEFYHCISKQKDLVEFLQRENLDYNTFANSDPADMLYHLANYYNLCDLFHQFDAELLEVDDIELDKIKR